MGGAGTSDTCIPSYLAMLRCSTRRPAPPRQAVASRSFFFATQMLDLHGGRRLLFGGGLLPQRHGGGVRRDQGGCRHAGRDPHQGVPRPSARPPNKQFWVNTAGLRHAPIPRVARPIACVVNAEPLHKYKGGVFDDNSAGAQSKASCRFVPHPAPRTPFGPPPRVRINSGIDRQERE